MKVRHKLLLSYLAISLLGGIVGYLGIKATDDIRQGFDQVVDETFPVTLKLSELQTAVNRVVIYTNEIVFIKHQQLEASRTQTTDLALEKRAQALAEKVDEWNVDKNDYRVVLRNYETLVHKFFPEEEIFLRQIKESSQKVIKVCEKLSNPQGDIYNSSASILETQEELEQANEEFEKIIKAALDHEFFELKERSENVNTTISTYKQKIFITSFLGFVLALTIAFFISSYVLRFVGKVKLAAIEIGKGNLDARINDLDSCMKNSTQDELGLLANVFNTMAEDLQHATAYVFNICESMVESLVVLSPDSRIESVNTATCWLVDYGSEKLIGQPVGTLFPEASELSQQLTLDYLEAQGSITNIETTYCTRSGQKIPVLFSASILRGQKGEKQGIVCIAQDITTLKQAQEANALQATALENVTDAIEITDREARYIYVNPAFEKITGYTQREVLGKTPAVLLRSGKHSDSFYQNMFDTVVQGKVWQGSLVSKHKDGSLYDQEISLSPICDAAGVMTHIVGVKRDITERQAMERMKDEFISTVSHELRTPLASIHGALDLLASGLMDAQSDKGKHVIQIAAENAERLVVLVNDILDLERLVSGTIRLDKKLCNTDDLLQQATDMMQIMAKRAKVRLSVTTQSIPLEADPDRILQVLSNLLSNAIKFSPGGATVKISTEFQPQFDHQWGLEPRRKTQAEQNQMTGLDLQVLFKVQDQGRGIPADKIERIFERFQQVDASDSRQKGGTGLGLAICRSIVEQHGGQIWAESDLQKGSCFYFTLPAIAAENDNNPQDLGVKSFELKNLSV